MKTSDQGAGLEMIQSLKCFQIPTIKKMIRYLTYEP